MGGVQLNTTSATLSCPQMNVCAYRNASYGYDGAWIISGDALK